jgi:hypothetical protein
LPIHDDKLYSRKKSDYPNFPRSSRFLWHGAGKDYYQDWDDFLMGKTDKEPLPFWEYVEERHDRLYGSFYRTRKFLRYLRREVIGSSGKEK